MSGFFGLVMTSLKTDITVKSKKLSKNATTEDISVSNDNLSNYNNFTYSWKTDGIDYTINSRSNKSTTVSGKSIIGKSKLYCEVSNLTNGVTYRTPECDLDWLEILTATISSVTRTYNGTSQTVQVLSGINGTYSGSTSASGTNVGTYTTTITGTDLYSGDVIGTLTISAITLTATSTPATRAYNGASQTVQVLSGVNGTFSGSTSASGTNVGTYTTTISGNGNYSGNVSGTLTITGASLSATPTTVYRSYNGTSHTVEVITGVSGTYSGSTVAYGVNAGTYIATITGNGNYSGSFTGYLVVSQAAGFVSLFLGDSYPAGYTSTVLFSRYLQSANASYVFTASVSGPGAGDAYLQQGFGVESRSLATAGFVVTLTATINDPNYTAGSATTTITFQAYSSGGGGGGTTYY